MAKIPSLSLLLALLAVLPSCAKVKEMHDATMQMNKTTSQLAVTSDDATKLMAELNDQGRQGAAVDIRNKSYLVMAGRTKFEEKAFAAGLYFQSFEFQLWNLHGKDLLPGRRDVLMRDAAYDFFNRLLAITHWEEVDPFAGTGLLSFLDSENEKMSFNAYALSLHENNRMNMIYSPDSPNEPVSMRTMIETALLAGIEIREGRKQLSDYPEYVDVILANEKNAIRLMQARYQILGLVVIDQFNEISQSKFKGFKYKILGSSWDIDMQKESQSKLALANRRIQEANRARSLLSQLGLETNVNENIAKMYASAKVKNAALSPVNSATVNGKVAGLHQELLANLASYLGQ